jgi:hypothetical protein
MEPRAFPQRSLFHGSPTPALLTHLGVLVLLGLYVVVPTHLASGDNVSHSLTALSIVRGSAGHLDGMAGEIPSGQSVYFIESIKGHWVAAYGLGVAAALAPIYAIGRAFGIDDGTLLDDGFNQLIAAIWVAASVWLLGLALRRLVAPAAAAFATLTTALGTSALSLLSREVWQHSLLLLLGAATLWVLLAVAPKRPVLACLLAGFFAGWGVAVRPPGLLYALVWLWITWRAAGRRAWAFLPPVAAWVAMVALYNWVTFGSPTTSGQLVNIAARFGTKPWQVLWSDPWGAFIGTLVSPGSGLFVYSPVLLWALLGLLVLRRGEAAAQSPGLTLHALIVPCLALVGANLLTIMSWREWWGGMCYGPRYASDGLVAWTLLTAAAWQATLSLRVSRRRITQGVAWLLLACSVLMHGAGVLVNPYEQGSWPQTMQPDSHPERLWRWQDFPPLYNLKAWLARRNQG